MITGQKVLAYIIRKTEERIELLVHEHRDFPEAGIQVPAGTVEENESLEEALLREISEESGLEGLTLVAKLGDYHYAVKERNELHHRHFYLLKAEKPVSATFVHRIKSHDSDNGLVFLYRWIPLENVKLAGEQDYFVNRINRSCEGRLLNSPEQYT
ncbi:NUDIX hydrolase [Pseudalkalibacillus caeni]|uniref:NUDIX hydrolase n=1 Tax=Exobacillus caeni TaxID=2574798 RepID=UPI0014853174|nr:NUDIX domain-containing protein [Pseudalkalibacillus caeni]